MSEKTFFYIKERLEKFGISYEAQEHAEDAIPEVAFGMCTPEQVPIAEGAKAAIVKGKKTGNYHHFVVPENRRLDQKKAQQIIGERFSFAGVEELLSVTECIPGAVPPFGSAISLKTYADHRLQQTEFLVFNAGTRTGSIKMRSVDYFIAEEPSVVDCATEETMTPNKENS